MTTKCVPRGPVLPRYQLYAYPSEANPLNAYVERMTTEASRDSTTSAIRALMEVLVGDSRASAATFPWHRLRYSQTARARAILAHRFAPPTANHRLTVLRGLLKEAWRLQYMSREEYERAKDLDRVRGGSPLRGRAIERIELQVVVDVCGLDPSPGGTRDAAILATCYGAGLRRGELVSLELRDWLRDEHALRVRGKGRRTRIVRLAAGVEQALDLWVQRRGRAPGPLFPVLDRRRRLRRGVRMSPSAVLYICKRRVREAGLQLGFTPHDLRRTCVSDLLDAGVDLVTTSAFVGHALTSTTAKYDRRGERAQRDAARVMHVPVIAGRTAA